MSLPSKEESWKLKLQNFQTKEKQYYPRYHLAPALGWMNDPNGLIYYNGLYHAFYQHYPDKPEWGPMHWGHATSEDMVHWIHHQPALWPGEDCFDKDGCFSGSAVIDEAGRLCLVYTGHQWTGPVGEDGQRPFKQVQCLATSSDGYNFEKQGVILTPPKGIKDFRDPKLWQQDGKWWLVLGVRSPDNHGQVYLYRGETLREWQFETILASSDGTLGYMWECPDFFPLGDKFALTFSPQGIQQFRGFKQRNLFDCGYLIGRWQPQHPFEIETAYKPLDYGQDYYAAQSFLAEDGRRIIMAWLDMWEDAKPSQVEGWAGALTLPREVSLDKDNQLLQKPIKELQSLREHGYKIAGRQIKNSKIKLKDAIRSDEFILQWQVKSATAEQFGLLLGNGLKLYVDTQSERLVLDRNYLEQGLSGTRSIPLPEGADLTLHIYFDNSSIEVFVNDGEACLTSRIFPAADDRSGYLYAAAGSAMLLNSKGWCLKSIA